MPDLNLSILMDRGRIVTVRPKKDLLEFPDATNFTPSELSYVLETAQDFIQYCQRRLHFTEDTPEEKHEDEDEDEDEDE